MGHPVRHRPVVLTVPPHQNLLHPPYSISNAHFTTKSLSGPRSLGNPHTLWVQFKVANCLCVLCWVWNLWGSFRKLLVPASHEVVSFCCAVAWRERFILQGLQQPLFTVRATPVDTSCTATPHVINALCWSSPVITAAKFCVLSIFVEEAFG